MSGTGNEGIAVIVDPKGQQRSDVFLRRLWLSGVVEIMARAVVVMRGEAEANNCSSWTN